MSASHTLSVPTVAGLTLELRCVATGPNAGQVDATLYAPKGKDARGARLIDRVAAFLCGGRIYVDVHVDARTHKYSPPVLWLRGAAIDIDDDAAATAQAWLDAHASAARVDQLLPAAQPGGLGTTAAAAAEQSA